MKSFNQKNNLIELANTIKKRNVPLGIGLHNQCWGGLAIEIAKSHNQTTKCYFGMTINDMKADINTNNNLSDGMRNEMMYRRTLEIASED